jgi:hypothetical protein
MESLVSAAFCRDYDYPISIVLLLIIQQKKIQIHLQFNEGMVSTVAFNLWCYHEGGSKK